MQRIFSWLAVCLALTAGQMAAAKPITYTLQSIIRYSVLADDGMGGTSETAFTDANVRLSGIGDTNAFTDSNGFRVFDLSSLVAKDITNDVSYTFGPGMVFGLVPLQGTTFIGIGDINDSPLIGGPVFGVGSNGPTEFSYDGRTPVNFAIGVSFNTGAANLADGRRFRTDQGNISIFSFQAVGGIPETSTWAMLAIGFGAIGGSMRATRRKALLSA